MTITVDNPQISVTLFKLVSRKNGVAQRYAGAASQVDLTPYIGEGSSVQTERSLADPVGHFTISIPDQPVPTIQDSIYALIEPMDMIEIRLARNASLYDGAQLPINMRGFVSRIRRVEQIGDDGAPQRQVVITGDNFGKLWQINSVFWQVAYSEDVPLLTLYQVDAILGMTTSFQSASDFVSQMVLNVMNAKIAKLSAFANRQVLPFSVECTVTEGLVTPAASATLTQGSYWTILSAFMDSPWNELFIRELESGPQVVFRPTPFKDINGNFLFGAVDPGGISVHISDVITMDVARTDDGVANYFWVDPNTSSLDTSAIVTAANIVDKNSEDFNYANNNPTLYGYRQMEGTTELFPNGVDVTPSDQTLAEANLASGTVLPWWQYRAEQLKIMNRDNAVFEEGSLSLKGNEALVPGIYLRVRRGALTSESYITSVTHNYVPFQSYTCSVQVERGDGFIKRNQYQGSPFWAEGRSGPYEPVVPFTAKIQAGSVTPAGPGS